MLPSDDYETESYEKNEILPFQRNKTALLLHENPEVYSSNTNKPGILLHFGSSANPMKSQLQFYISPDFSLFIKPSMMQSKYGTKKKSSSISKLSNSFMNQRENLKPETFEDITNPERFIENPAPLISNNFSEGIAYLIEMISKLASVTSNFHTTLPEKVESDLATETTESSIESEELDDTNIVEGFVDIDEDNLTQNISNSTTIFPSELLVNETLVKLQTLHHNDRNQTTNFKDDSEVNGNQSQIFAIKTTDDENLVSTERENNSQVYYSIIGPKNITYIEADSNGKFGKQTGIFVKA
ncbi:unnamed protein product [Orchesella dallaii]|uniref:Uncharacterized protein n=1 Tax=Orchesella dallaii TaxID=48710 RepID=A0ABP1QDH5_9HEXA